MGARHAASGTNRALRDAMLLSGPPVVLVAEDDDELRHLLVRSLSAIGCEVVEARDGAEVVRRVRTEGAPQVALVVSDVKMPRCSGLAALALLRAGAWEKPFVLITAFGDAEVHTEALRLGAAAVFDKPFELDDLCAMVFALLH